MRIDPSVPLLREHIRKLEAALQFYVDAFPAFRSKPVGAPGSIEREAQSVHCIFEDEAKVLLGPASQSQRQGDGT